MFLHICFCTLLDYTPASHYIKVLHIIYLGVIYIIDAASEWCTTFAHNLLISFVCSLCHGIFSISSNCYGFNHKYVGILEFSIETRFQHCSSKSDLTIYIIISASITVDLHSFLCIEFRLLISCVVELIYDFLILNLLLI